jgi:hypothetical protein
MSRGKNICKHLKEVRKRIAEENDIPLEIKECTYKGECRGTCPRCEAEVRYLENALADRLRLGKVATVAGLALGLATTTAQATEVLPSVLPDVPSVISSNKTHTSNSIITLRGTVVDAKTDEPLPFVSIRVLKDRKPLVGMKTVEVCESNFDGEFIVNVPKGSYTIVVSYFGYLSDTIAETHYDADTILAPIRLVVNPDIKMETIEIEEPMMTGVIDEEYFQANPAWQRFEKDGIKVKVR